VSRCTATTRAGKRCARTVAADGETVCLAHRGGNASLFGGGGAAPRILDDETSRMILDVLRSGSYVETAARAAGISPRTFYDWWRRGRANGGDPADEPYRAFRDACEKARAEGEARNVAIIASASRRSWKAAAWLLERQHPERWGKTSVRARDEAPPEPLPATVNEFDDPFAEVDELSARRGRTA
jgi:transposase-like protein